MKNVLLQKIKIKNFLGYKGEQTIETDNGNLVFIGKNNSGKSATVAALYLLKKIVRDTKFIIGHGSGGPQRYIIIDWAHCVHATPDIFHHDTEESEIVVTYKVTTQTYNLQSIFSTIGISLDPIVTFSFGVKLKNSQVALSLIAINDIPYFKLGHNTPLFTVSNNNHYSMNEGAKGEDLISFPNNLLAEMVYFPSIRVLQGKDNAKSIDDLASGSSVLKWIQDANNADSRNADARIKHRSLEKFNLDFAKFIGAKNVKLVVSGGTQLQLNIDGIFTPIESLGTGIAECLLILLTSKISKDVSSTLHTLILEEPELHLHPQMQRQLMQILAADNLNLICTTHSPTVLNEMIKIKSSVYHTKIHNQTIVPQKVQTNTEIINTLDDIGATPADVLQAEKVIWVEGPTDVPTFHEWIRKCPAYNNQSVAIVPLGGDTTGEKSYDFTAHLTLNRNSLVILDSERDIKSGPPARARKTALSKCEAIGMPIRLTERRSTESYFTSNAIATVYPSDTVPTSIDPYKPITSSFVKFDKKKGYLVAKAMDWTDIKDTDIGLCINAFLSDQDISKYCSTVAKP